MAQLLRKNEQLPMRNFQALRSRLGPGAIWTRSGRSGADDVDPNRNAALLLNLANSDRTVRTIQYSFNESALRDPRAISKLWHRAGK